MSEGQVRPWWACSGDPCTCPRPAPAEPPRTVYGIRPHRQISAKEAKLLRLMAEATPLITAETFREQGLLP